LTGAVGAEGLTGLAAEDLVVAAGFMAAAGLVVALAGLAFAARFPLVPPVPLLAVAAVFDLAALRTGAFSAAVRFAINLGFADLPLKVRFLVEDLAEDGELLLLRKLGREEDLFKPFTTGSLMGASTFKGGFNL
jgi:hypothetical protein